MPTPLNYESPQERRPLPGHLLIPRARVVGSATAATIAYVAVTTRPVIWYTGTHPNYWVAIEQGDILIGPVYAGWNVPPFLPIFGLTLALLAATSAVERLLAKRGGRVNGATTATDVPSGRSPNGLT